MSEAGRKVMRELLWEAASMDPNSVEVMGYIPMLGIDVIPSSTYMASGNGTRSNVQEWRALDSPPRIMH